MNDLSHISDNNTPKMVDVSDKSITKRTARARALVFFPEDALQTLSQSHFIVKKGAVVQTAVIAGIMGAKKTADLIPMCHPLSITKVEVHIQPINTGLEVVCTVALEGKTGVEMEALTGASIAALTIYDMCKSLSHDIRIEQIELLEKRGGKSDLG
jgi:cyclic pyranopterin phosphate synthase